MVFSFQLTVNTFFVVFNLFDKFPALPLETRVFICILLPFKQGVESFFANPFGKPFAVLELVPIKECITISTPAMTIIFVEPQLLVAPHWKEVRGVVEVWLPARYTRLPLIPQAYVQVEVILAFIQKPWT